MKTIVDLHIHGAYAMACSKQTTIQKLADNAKIKGLNLLGTGDCLHPKWFQNISSELQEDHNGILWTKETNPFPFIWQTELSVMYTQDGKGRRIHHVILMPNKDVVIQVRDALLKRGRLDYDGRPIFGFSSIELVEMMRSISEDIEIIPAHAWTSWMSIFGSKSGFNSVEECFKEKSKYIHAIETGLSCYDIKTEVLTQEGWKKFTEINYKDKICTLNKNNEIEYQPPFKIHNYKYKGKMYRLKTKRVNLFVTPNHRLFVTTCDFRSNKPFFLREAELLFRKSKQFKKDGMWKGENKEFFVLPSIKTRHGSRYYKGFREIKQKIFPIKDWLKFFGFWIAEGWTNKGNNSDYNVCLANKNKKLINEMKKILESFGYTTFYEKKTITLRVRSFQLFSYLEQFGKCNNKYIPQDIKQLSGNLLEILLNSYIKGDGHIYGRTNKGLSATTTSTKLRDDLQEIALKIGYSAYYKLHRKKGTPFISPGQQKKYLQRNDSWVIYFLRKNKHAVIPSTIKKYNHIERWEDFKGNVYCVSVPNEVIYVRRNGIPVWCGNSDPYMNRRVSFLDKYNLVSFSDPHSYHNHRLGREATILDLKNLTYQNILNAIRTGEGLNGTIEVNPAYGKYHIDGHRACGVVLQPEESKKLNGICPKCKTPLTIGVAYRIEELADRKVPINVPFYMEVIPLAEVIALIFKKGVSTKGVAKEYNSIISKFDTEFNVLMNVSLEDLKKVTHEKIAEAIVKIRERKVKYKEGYDGIYGWPILTEDYEKVEPKQNNLLQDFQKGLNEFSH